MENERIIYEDDIERLKEALTKRPAPRGGWTRAAIARTLYFLNHEDALYDLMMYLKYGVKPKEN